MGFTADMSKLPDRLGRQLLVVDEEYHKALKAKRDRDATLAQSKGRRRGR